MATENKAEAKFSIVLDANPEVALATADGLSKLKDAVQGGESKIKELNATMRRLRGNTEEVKDAKKTLKAQIEAEKTAISAVEIKLLQHGTTIEGVMKKEKALSESVKKSNASQLGLKEALSKSLNELKLSHPAMAALASGALVAAAAVAALGIALTAGALSLGKWIIESANLLRSENLAREVMLGNAQNAENLGDHIQILAGKVSTARSKLNEYAIELSRTRISGNALVDTLNAMGQASGAGLDDLAGKLKEIATRGQLVGRMQLSPQELLGSGLEFNEVAEALGKSMGIGINKAKKALFEGRVKIDDGAKALKLAVEKRFGEINLRKMLDLNVMSAKFKEGMMALTRDVKIDPLLKGLNEIGSAFSINTVSGKALKGLIESFGGSISEGFGKAAPYITKFFQGMIIGALETQIFFYKLRNAIKDTFGETNLKDLVTFERAVNAGRYAVFAAVGAVAALTAAVAISAALIVGPYVAAFALIVAALNKVRDYFKFFSGVTVEEWKGIGSAIVNGLLDGIRAAWDKLKSAVSGLAGSTSQVFKDALQIKSPSKVFEADGKNIALGVAQGIEKEAPTAEKQAGGMLDGVKRARGGGAGGPVNVSVTINAAGGDVSSVSFVEQLREAIANALLDAGVST